MKRGIIIINAYSRLPSALNQSRRLKEEFAALGVETDVVRNDFFPFYVEEKLETVLNGYDFCVYLDKDKYVSEVLEKSGLRLFNSHNAIQVCDDKMRTHIALAGVVPMPKTLAGLLCYDPQIKVTGGSLDKIENALGYPLVVKSCYGSLGKQVYKADNRAELKILAEKLKCEPHLFQKFIPESAGRDVRVIVIGGKAVAAMKRTSERDFRSNIELGGRGERAVLDGELILLCQKTADALKLDYCGIDLLLGKGGYLVCEVNSNAFFGGIERVTGVNVARLYARHILNSI